MFKIISKKVAFKNLNITTQKYFKFLKKTFAKVKKDCIFASSIARVAQLVELQPSKLTVAGSSPVSRSKKSQTFVWLFYFKRFPKSNNNTIGIPNITTVKVLFENTSGYTNNVKAKPPIAPPKCAVCPILPNFFFIP